jgi:hypothetical protein
VFCKDYTFPTLFVHRQYAVHHDKLHNNIFVAVTYEQKGKYRYKISRSMFEKYIILQTGAYFFAYS